MLDPHPHALAWCMLLADEAERCWSVGSGLTATVSGPAAEGNSVRFIAVATDAAGRVVHSQEHVVINPPAKGVRDALRQIVAGALARSESAT